MRKADLSPYFEDGARWGVGVSGGGDSVALLLMLLEAGFGKQVHVIHFNHKWGAFGDKAEAFVRDVAKRKKVAASFGLGKGKAKTNAEAKGREARLAFFAEACEAHGLDGVMLAHTRSDDVETFLIRLARGSGLKGLVGMREVAEVGGVVLARPLLALTRNDLRAYLKAQKQAYLDDPANGDDAHLRVRVRKVIPALEKAGVAEEHMAAAMAGLKRADQALEMIVDGWWDANAQVVKGQVRLDVAGLRAQPTEVAQRLLAKGQDMLLPAQAVVRASKRLALLEQICKKASGKAALGGVLWSWRGQSLVGEVEPRQR